jgi:lactoylglutathione lyase
MFVSAFPILATRDLPRLLAFYRDLLDGSVSYQFPDGGEPAFVALDIGTSQLGLADDPDLPDGDRPPDARFSLWIYAEDCDAAVERLRAGGTRILEEPADQPWGERIARVLDPDANRVIIGSPPG